MATAEITHEGLAAKEKLKAAGLSIREIDKKIGKYHSYSWINSLFNSEKLSETQKNVLKDKLGIEM